MTPLQKSYFLIGVAYQRNPYWLLWRLSKTPENSLFERADHKFSYFLTDLIGISKPHILGSSIGVEFLIAFIRAGKKVRNSAGHKTMC